MDDEFEYEDIETVTLEFEDGDSKEFEVIGTFEYEECSYIALTPFDGDGEDDEDEDEPEIYLYACTEDEDGFLTISDIEDDDLYEAVSKRFVELANSDGDDD